MTHDQELAQWQEYVLMLSKKVDKLQAELEELRKVTAVDARLTELPELRGEEYVN